MTNTLILQLPIAKELRRRGINVTTTVETKLRSKSDQLQLAFATKEQRVLVTYDDDFLKLASINSNHSGICLLSPRNPYYRTNCSNAYINL